MMEPTSIHENHLSLSHDLIVAYVVNDVGTIPTSNHWWICQVLSPSHPALVVHTCEQLVLSYARI